MGFAKVENGKIILIVSPMMPKLMQMTVKGTGLSCLKGGSTIHRINHYPLD